jgi:hypothetical protein
MTLSLSGRSRSPLTATRVDTHAGIVERHGFLEGPAGRLYQAVHGPLASASGVVVVCSSILNDLTLNYRREVVLARALAVAGITTVRFHYLGTGHSDGSGEHVGFEGMVEDARTVLDDVDQEAPLAVLGTRLGAIVAAAAIGERPGVPIALWEPTLDGDDFFAEAVRAANARRASGGPGGTSLRSLRDASSGSVDVCGHALHHELFRSWTGQRLTDHLGTQRRRIFLAQLAPGERLRHDYLMAVAGWRRAGSEVHAERFPVQPMWWFAELSLPPDDLIAATVGWLRTSLEGGSDP